VNAMPVAEVPSYVIEILQKWNFRIETAGSAISHLGKRPKIRVGSKQINSVRAPIPGGYL
jgi:hypothetical protein